MDALRVAQRSKKLSVRQPNGDDVDLIAIVHDEKAKLLTLLFHRTSPDAADPAYRKVIEDRISLRQTTKERDEEQAVSAHLVIDTRSFEAGAYNAALEEMPGLSLSVVKQIIAGALTDYKYAYEDKKGNEQETYSTFKALGQKSENLTDALKKKGSINYLTLTRTKIPDAPDSEGIAEPTLERLRYKIVGDPTSKGWREGLAKFVTKVREQEWDDVSLDLSLDDDRHRTVKLEREAEAAEIMFVRAEQVVVSRDLTPCTMEVVPELVEAAQKLMAKG
ncbi:hypothetical protein [Sphingomonas oligoaromativorans]|uniref:hypothetical protein n=1 Tax=Sphingomonas oligoaromativorans TaxID=575322 RepID=UPI001421BEF0|nr:hypothetical protein [Sphingomonas oligoaromativorans]NIJ34178.1 hypothetical protein [Sphingomonas oligoaromativorans]